ncbi:MAG: hypothetical protein MRY77_07240 [Rhodobacteraceae bacterium]|nr:hypothetical protein [Paracoccaceae bacterium]
MPHRMQDQHIHDRQTSEGAVELFSMILIQSDFLHQISLERLIDRSDALAAASNIGSRK